jgi:hypothetical protein
MATKLESSFQVPQMLDQIILQLLMSVGVSKFLTQRFAGRRLDVRTAGEEAAWVFGAVEGFIWR